MPSPQQETGQDQPSLLGRAMAKRNEWASQQPSLGGQLAAMFREGIKDIRQTLNETYFGKGEHMPEAGAPMNPTQQQVTVEQGNFRGYQASLDDLAQRSEGQEPEERDGHSR